MSFPFVNKNLRLNILKARTAMNEKISVFVICVETILYLLLYNLHDCNFKGAVTDMRYFARSKVSRSLVHKKHFSLIWPVDDKDMYFAKRGRIPLLSLNELGEKSHPTIILGKFVNKPYQTLIGLWFSENVFHWSKFKPRSHDIFFSWTFDLLLMNSSRYLFFGVYFPPHHRNIVSENKLQKKPIMK